MPDRHEKKSESLEVRLSYDQKRSFMQACKRQGTTASGAVRSFVSGYIQKDAAAAPAGPSPRPIEEMTVKTKSNPRRLVSFLAGMGGMALLFGATPSMADDDVFAALDKNADSFITMDELPSGGPESGAADLLAAMDADQDGKISATEFVPKANVVSVVHEGEAVVDGVTGFRLRGRRTDYDLTGAGEAKISVIVMKNTYTGDDAIDPAAKAEQMRAQLAAAEISGDDLEGLLVEADRGTHDITIEEEMTADGKQKIRKRIIKKDTVTAEGTE